MRLVAILKCSESFLRRVRIPFEYDVSIDRIQDFIGEGRRRRVFLPLNPLFTLKKMRHVAALLLCVLGGNSTPSVADIEKVIKSFGGEFDQEQAEKLVKELEGKNVEEVIKAGKAKLATVSVGAAPAAGTATSGAAPAKVEEKVVEEEEEVEMSGGMDMFGGDEDY
ncbi:unnamed protein product [Peronospora belbahrii]|uniref:60S acidic ribosomal protein P2 n=1 Tax=Peronospora belbahrii TaxID=622444 RepID=A0AAU9KRG9_9STRA|nr:unnamed protein product [Peronospora belbahrii]